MMAEEGLRVVRQWLEASSELEEGERGSGQAFGWGPGKARLLTGTHLSLDQPRFTADGRWKRTGVCLSSTPTRQNMGLTSPGAWVRRLWGRRGVGKSPGRGAILCAHV